ncbi:1-aminocyclopropane-1-carboxylate deaminase [Mycobacteroides abscessus 1948]|uniref:1-aminocyclopropane-1-carboxylate deaminase n=1 Tax=Mycobacteroides abscessus 1948 TaxID=1299323 RepID=A0A829QBC1_9MYCO|nr:1-aminocyclopropane-1-carboxylate deaminase [Mycobacteroides abscessus 1948]
MSIHDFARYPLTFGPSPVHPLQRLSSHLGGAQIWAKREDCNSGLAFGGNKVRKLEYIVPDILASGADTLVSIGGYQSNHTRQVAAVAAVLGMRCHLVQERWVDWDDPGNDKVGNILLSRIMGAHTQLDPAGFDIGIRQSWEEALTAVENAGGKPYPIPAGASEHKYGGLGFANWAYEVAAQEEQLGVFFDTIVVCTVTGSTHAGMIAGFAALADAGGRRGGCSVSTRPPPSRRPPTRSPASHAIPRTRSDSNASCAPKKSPCSRVGQAKSTAYLSIPQSKRSSCADGWRR